MLIINCPACKRWLRLPEHIPDCSLKCPACRVEFLAMENPSPSQCPPVRKVAREEGIRLGEHEEPLSLEFQDNKALRLPSIVIQGNREGTIRRTMAVVGLVGWPVIFVGLLVKDLASGVRWSILEIIGALVLAIVTAPLFAAIGAGFGIMMEILVRLLGWRPGASLLLTLVADSEGSSLDTVGGFSMGSDCEIHSDSLERPHSDPGIRELE